MEGGVTSEHELPQSRMLEERQALHVDWPQSEGCPALEGSGNLSCRYAGLVWGNTSLGDLEFLPSIRGWKVTVTVTTDSSFGGPPVAEGVPHRHKHLHVAHPGCWKAPREQIC